MMHESEKSDAAIRAKKPANKAVLAAAQWVEQRAGTKGNMGHPRTNRMQRRDNVSQRLGRVRHAAWQRKKDKFSKDPSSMAGAALCRQTPKVGAVCGNSARTDLCGGCPVMGVSTAIMS